MPLSLFIGAGGISLSPLIALFTIFIAPSYVRIIFWIVGAFCWLLSLLLTASIWQIWYVSTKSNPDLNNNLAFGALLGVVIQEVVRLLALWGLSKVVKLLESRGSIGRGNDSLDMSGSAGYFVIGMGLGFGSLATLFHMMNVLAASLGPGSPGLEINGISNGNQNLYFTSAFFAAALTLNHVAWTVIAGVAIELGNSNRSKGLIAFILIAHFLCTGTSLLNNTGPVWPAMVTTWLSVFGSGLLAMSESGFKKFIFSGEAKYHPVRSREKFPGNESTTGSERTTDSSDTSDSGNYSHQSPRNTKPGIGLISLNRKRKPSRNSGSDKIRYKPTSC